MILTIKAKDIIEGDYIMLDERDYRVFPLWVMAHSANYAGRRLQISTGIGIVKRRYNEIIQVWRFDCFEERFRMVEESREKRKRAVWYRDFIRQFRNGGMILESGEIVPSYPH